MQGSHCSSPVAPLTLFTPEEDCKPPARSNARQVTDSSNAALVTAEKQGEWIPLGVSVEGIPLVGDSVRAGNDLWIQEALQLEETCRNNDMVRVRMGDYLMAMFALKQKVALKEWDYWKKTHGDNEMERAEFDEYSIHAATAEQLEWVRPYVDRFLEMIRIAQEENAQEHDKLRAFTEHLAGRRQPHVVRRCDHWCSRGGPRDRCGQSRGEASRRALRQSSQSNWCLPAGGLSTRQEKTHIGVSAFHCPLAGPDQHYCGRRSGA